MKRNRYDKQTFSFAPLKCGRLQTIGQFPVMAGESIELKMATIVRLSPLRRAMIVEPKVEIAAFFVPHRHIYGQDWIDFIQQGNDESVSLAQITATGGIGSGTDAHFLALGGREALVGKPLHVLAGYNRIWNRFFRVPSDDSATTFGFGEIADNAVQGADLGDRELRHYGYRIAYPKTAWNTGVDETIAAADREVSVSAGKIDLPAIDQQRAHYGTELARQFFNAAERYTDMLKAAFGGYANSDADQRPTMLMHSEQYVSGYDIDGTGDTTLGQYSGKGAGRILFGFPRRFFPEHGQIFLLAWLRYPLICADEMNPLNTKGNLSYRDQAGDPRIIANQPPEPVDVRDWIGGSVNVHELNSRKTVSPYGQHYRVLPQACIHPDYDDLSGFPILQNGDFANRRALHYVDSSKYDGIYQTTQLGHAQFQANIHLNVDSLVPRPMESIMTGAANR